MSSEPQFADTPQSADDENDALTDDLFAALDELGEDTGANEAAGEGEPLPAEGERAAYALPYTPHLTLTPRPYQRAAVDAWLRAERTWRRRAADRSGQDRRRLRRYRAHERTDAGRRANHRTVTAVARRIDHAAGVGGGFGGLCRWR